LPPKVSRALTWASWANGSDGEIVRYLARKGVPWLTQRDEAVEFIPGTWVRWFHEIRVPQLVELIGELPARIDRNQLREIAKSSEGQGLLKLFLAAMVWGRGKRNARMKKSLQRAFISVRESGLLRSSRDFLHQDDLAAGWREARKIPGLREPFFTKWLYAASLAPGMPRRALVRDANVKAALWELGWDSKARAESRSLALRYAVFVDCVHFWANQLAQRTGDHTIQAETVELALFRLGRDEIPVRERFRPETAR
jgi:hypothetical protein